jgi:hypothetical protein
MGKQYDKVIKRRRRLAYLERRKQKAKDAAVAASKPRPRKAPAAKKAAPKEKEHALPKAELAATLAAVSIPDTESTEAEPAPAAIESAPAE